MIEKQTVAVLLVDQDGNILQVSRKNDPNDFGLPGGKVEPGESLYDAALRELLEETGYEARGLHHLLTQQARTSMCKVYYSILFEKKQEPRAGEGAVRWASPEKMVSGTFADFNARILRELILRGVRC